MISGIILSPLYEVIICLCYDYPFKPPVLVVTSEDNNSSSLIK